MLNRLFLTLLAFALTIFGSNIAILMSLQLLLFYSFHYFGTGREDDIIQDD